MSSAEFYTAFQRGIIDVVSLNDAAGEIFKIDELTTHRTYANLSRVILEMCLNKRWVDALPADLRAVVDHWGRGASQVDAQLSFMLGGAQARKGFVEKGIELIDLSDEEESRWQEAVAPVIDEYVRENEAAGRPAKQLLADMKALVAQYSKMTPNEIMMETINDPVTGFLPGT
jgi:TRAP-type C4-dicarboxylate transport system substrate-binding protein